VSGREKLAAVSGPEKLGAVSGSEKLAAVSGPEHFDADGSCVERADEDAAVLLTLLTVLAAAPSLKVEATTRSYWGKPVFAAGQPNPAIPGAWWASGLPR